MKPTRFEGAEKCIQTIFGLKVSYGLLLTKFKFDYSTLSKKSSTLFILLLYGSSDMQPGISG